MRIQFRHKNNRGIRITHMGSDISTTARESSRWSTTTIQETDFPGGDTLLEPEIFGTAESPFRGIGLGRSNGFVIRKGSILSGAQVLVADDDPMQRAKLSLLLRRSGYEVVEASNGAEAWEVLGHTPIRLVFTDWMMPEMNGLELIRRIRASDLGHYVYIILCTGKESKADLVEGISSGADDFLSKPADPDELRARLHAGERVIELEVKLAREKQELGEAYQSLTIAHQKIRSDLQAAAKLQKSLLPRPGSHQNVRFDWLFRPTAHVAGDIFNVFPLDNQHIGFYQLDVSGHGIPSAMLSFTLSKALSPTPLRDSIVKRVSSEPPYYQIVPPNVVVQELNHSFQNDNDMYFTIAYGVLNSANGHLQLTQAGHPSPILARKNNAPRLLGSGGFPVAALPDLEFDIIEEDLQPGDRLLLCSDGISECYGITEQQFGIERVLDCLNRGADESLEGLMRSLDEELLRWRGSEEFDDDVSVLAVELSRES
jgi:sigma-B regulation protein RsbU (phosphoserine phosphatase)